MFDAHFAKRYVAQRAQRSRDPALIEATRRSMGAEEYDHAVGPPADAGAAEKGVRIQFDERILADVLGKGTPEETARLLQELGARLAAARTDDQRSAAVAGFEALVTERYRRSRATVELSGLTAVSLKRLVARAEAASGDTLPDEVLHPGPLSRIHGYAAVGDDLLILGRMEPGDEPIALDDLVLGVRAAWKENETPLVSLDPDPENIEGDPRVRVQGVPGDSAFALTMLEADYAMKRIMAGVEPVEAPGYETLRSILDGTDRDFISRFWLYPVQPGMGDIEIAADGSSALFAGAVQVLSEEMRLLKEGLVGTGKTYGAAERAARSFTAHYEAIAGEKRAFRRLEGLFDVVLLARIWRTTGRASPLLDRLCALPHRPVKVPATYPAVRVVVRTEGGTEFVLSGGAQAKVGAGRFSWLALERGEFQGLAEGGRALVASGRLSGAIAGPPVPVPAPSGSRDEASLEFGQAVAGLLQGDLDAALAAADRLVGKAPTDAEALMLRAIVHVRRADYGRARRDAERARELDPDSPETDAAVGEVLFQCAWMEGDPAEALETLEWTLRKDPDGARAHVARGETLALLDRPDDARAAFRKALDIDPASAVACARLATLELAEGRTLDAKPWIQRARALGADLPEVRMAEASWQLVTVRPDLAEALARGVWDDKAASPTVRLQALAVLASVAASRERWTEVDERIAMMGQLAAGSPEVLVVAAEIAFTWGERKRGEAYLQQAERLAPGHPLVKKLRAARSR
jgi:Flp pilus assembly protein TadD